MRKARDATAILRFPRAHAIRPGLVSTESEKTALHWPDREAMVLSTSKSAAIVACFLVRVTCEVERDVISKISPLIAVMWEDVRRRPRSTWQILPDN